MIRTFRATRPELLSPASTFLYSTGVRVEVPLSDRCGVDAYGDGGLCDYGGRRGGLVCSDEWFLFVDVLGVLIE